MKRKKEANLARRWRLMMMIQLLWISFSLLSSDSVYSIFGKPWLHCGCFAGANIAPYSAFVSTWHSWSFHLPSFLLIFLASSTFLPRRRRRGSFSLPDFATIIRCIVYH